MFSRFKALNDFGLTTRFFFVRFTGCPWNHWLLGHIYGAMGAEGIRDIFCCVRFHIPTHGHWNQLWCNLLQSNSVQFAERISGSQGSIISIISSNNRQGKETEAVLFLVLLHHWADQGWGRNRICGRDSITKGKNCIPTYILSEYEIPKTEKAFSDENWDYMWHVECWPSGLTSHRSTFVPPKVASFF